MIYKTTNTILSLRVLYCLHLLNKNILKSIGFVLVLL